MSSPTRPTSTHAANSANWPPWWPPNTVGATSPRATPARPQSRRNMMLAEVRRRARQVCCANWPRRKSAAARAHPGEVRDTRTVAVAHFVATQFGRHSGRRSLPFDGLAESLSGSPSRSRRTTAAAAGAAESKGSVGGHRNLPTCGHHVATPLTTEGERSPGILGRGQTVCGTAPYRQRRARGRARIGREPRGERQVSPTGAARW